MLPIQNMVNLLKASYANVISNFPQAKNILYDADNQSFYNKNSGQRYSDEDVKNIAKTKQSRSANAGLATLKRTAIANTILQGAVQEGRGRTIQEASRERLGDGVKGTLIIKRRLPEVQNYIGVDKNGNLIRQEGAKQVPVNGKTFVKEVTTKRILATGVGHSTAKRFVIAHEALSLLKSRNQGVGRDAIGRMAKRLLESTNTGKQSNDNYGRIKGSSIPDSLLDAYASSEALKKPLLVLTFTKTLTSKTMVNLLNFL